MLARSFESRRRQLRRKSPEVRESWCKAKKINAIGRPRVQKNHFLFRHAMHLRHFGEIRAEIASVADGNLPLAAGGVLLGVGVSLWQQIAYSQNKILVREQEWIEGYEQRSVAGMQIEDFRAAPGVGSQS